MEKRLPVINEVRILGNVVKDPEIRETNAGTPVANFRIAASRRFKDRNGNRKEETCYVGVVAWGRLAELCSQRLYKSDTVFIEGELQTRNWTVGDQKRTMVEINAHRIQFLDKIDRREPMNSDSDNSNVLPEDGPLEQGSELVPEDNAPEYEREDEHEPN